MGIDLSKLTPAPWGPPVSVLYEMLGEAVAGFEVGNDVLASSAFCRKLDDAAFIALARNAFDVMMRRGLIPDGCLDEWAVMEPDIQTPEGTVCSCKPIGGKRWPDPFTSLVEADRWLTERDKANA